MIQTAKTERQLNKLLSAAGCILVVLSILLMSVLTVPAAEESGSLTLRCVFSVEGGERVLAGDEYSLVKIADANISESSVRYVTLSPFKSYDCDWARQSSSVMNDKAKALARHCEQNDCYTDSAATDRNGELKFDDLETGLYLVARTKTADANRDFVTDPLLFFIPQDMNGEPEYDISATPKFSYISPYGNDEPHTPSDGTLPQTGQLLWPVTLLAVLGCFLIIGGSALMSREGSDEKKTR